MTTPPPAVVPDALTLPRRRRELGAFLRQRRSRTQPAAIGLTGAGRRRVTGLRRAEVADAAGIGPGWYTMLEQGRVENVSARTLDAVADALRLDGTERRHLRALAAGSLVDRLDLTPPNAELLDFVRTYPLGGAFLHSPRFDVVAANAFADEMFGFSAVAAPNVLELVATSAAAQACFVRPSWEGILRLMSGHFGTWYGMIGGADYESLIDRLCERSPAFARIWRDHPLFEPPVEDNAIVHPRHGSMVVDVITLRPLAHPAYTLAFMAPRAAPP